MRIKIKRLDQKNFKQKITGQDTQERQSPVSKTKTPKMNYNNLVEINKNNYLHLFACCLLTKGHKRSIIVDTQRKNFFFVPNDLYDLLISDIALTVTDFLSSPNESNRKVLREYLKFLVKKELVFFSDEANRFPKINTETDDAFTIDNVVIDIRKTIRFDLQEAITLFEDLNVQVIQFRVFEGNKETMREIVKSLKNKTFNSVEILINHNASFTIGYLAEMISDNPMIAKMVIFNCDKNAAKKINFYKISTHDYPLTGKEMCGVVSSKYFNTDFYHFAESLNHNTCLNGKISIDEEGNIKHCPSMNENFGFYNKENVLTAIKSKKYIKMSNIAKHQIEICKDCEFRNVCTDCRAYLSDSGNIFSKPQKCKYDPYTATWSSN